MIDLSLYFTTSGNNRCIETNEVYDEIIRFPLADSSKIMTAFSRLRKVLESQ